MVVAKPEEINLEIQPESPRTNHGEIYGDTSVSQGNRSYDPVEYGRFIETQTYDNSDKLENINYKCKPHTDVEYDPKSFLINLLLPDREQAQMFKLAFRNTYNQK